MLLREKIRQRISQRCGGDELGGSDARSNRAQPGAKGRPDRARMLDGQGLQKSLKNQADLDVAVVGAELASHAALRSGRQIRSRHRKRNETPRSPYTGLSACCQSCAGESNNDHSLSFLPYTCGRPRFRGPRGAAAGTYATALRRRRERSNDYRWRVGVALRSRKHSRHC